MRIPTLLCGICFDSVALPYGHLAIRCEIHVEEHRVGRVVVARYDVVEVARVGVRVAQTRHRYPTVYQQRVAMCAKKGKIMSLDAIFCASSIFSLPKEFFFFS